MIVIDRKVDRMVELAWLVALLAELGHERAVIIITREYLHSMIATIDDEQETSMMVEHQAKRIVELAISVALLLGANRELDSSITIKSIVSHLLHFNLSLSHNDKEMIQAPNCSNQRDEDMKLSLSLSYTRHERETKQASKQRATRSNKNQSMKEQRTLCAYVDERERRSNIGPLSPQRAMTSGPSSPLARGLPSLAAPLSLSLARPRCSSRLSSRASSLLRDHGRLPLCGFARCLVALRRGRLGRDQQLYPRPRPVPEWHGLRWHRAGVAQEQHALARREPARQLAARHHCRARRHHLRPVRRVHGPGDAGPAAPPDSRVPQRVRALSLLPRSSSCPARA